MDLHEARYAQLLRNAFRGTLRGNNPFILALGGLIVLVGSALTAGLLFGPLAVGLARASLHAVRGEPVELDDLKAGFADFWPSFVAGIVTLLAVVLGLALLVVPGVIALFVLQYTAHVLADEPGIGGIEAMRRSYALAKANLSPTTVLFVVAAALSAVLSLTGIGAVIAAAFIGAVIAEFYVALDEPPAEAGASEPANGHAAHP